MIISSIREVIGNTPMLKITQKEYSMPEGSSIYAKLDYLNPGGSIKDRLGLSLIEKALEKRSINQSSTIIEPTAGNTGIGLALAASRYGIKTLFVIPEKFSIEKQQLMKALGAEIIHTPTKDGIVGAIKKAKELHATIPNSYLPSQFDNFDNPLTYYETLGPEIFKDLGPTITSFVAGIGSGGTFAGVSQYLLEKQENIRIIGVEPEGSILNGGPSHGHDIEGIGVEFIPPFLKDIPIDQFFTISDEEGFFYTRQLALNNGLLVGSSSGAAFAAALKEVQQLPPGSTVVTIFPDASDRYLSKNIYL
ncbi:MAG: cysK [Bacillales bacterium]|nr:cysK [Bacillales bacterium]